MSLHEELPEMQYVVVSGHADFSYAKTALALGVREYITKPIDSNQLFSAVQNCISHISKQRTEQKQQQLLQERLKNLSWQEEASILHDLVAYEIKDLTSVENRLQMSGLSHIVDGEVLLMVMAFNEARRLRSSITVDEWESLEIQIVETFEQQLRDRFSVLCRPIGDGQFLCIVKGLSKLVPATQHATLQEVLEQVVRQCKHSLSMGIGMATDSLSHYYQEWKHALSALESSLNIPIPT